MIILDSNIWIAFLNTQDSQHLKAVKVFNSLDSNIFITEYLIIEIATILSVKVNKRLANQFLDQIIKTKGIYLLKSEIFFEKTLNLFQKVKNNKLSFIDISLFYLSSKYSIITFDSDLEKAIKFIT